MLTKLRNAAIIITVVASAGSGAVCADELRIGGTGAGYNLLLRLGNAFAKPSAQADTVEVLPGLGSSGGIAAVAEGVLQIAISGRPLKPEEREKGLKSSSLLETPFILVTSNRDPLKLSTANLVDIFNGRMRKWPDGKDIRPILRPKSDAVSAFLADNIIGMREAMEVLRKRPDVLVAATDQDNVEAAERIPNSLAAMTLVQFLTERPKLHLIELDGVEPSVDAMRNGRYSLKTELHLVVGPQVSEAAMRFIAFLTTPEAVKIINDHGGLARSTITLAYQ